MYRPVAVIVSVALASIVGIAGSAGASVQGKGHKPSPSCVRALNEAQQVFDTSVSFDQDVGAFFKSVQQSAQAHAAGTVDDLTAFINDTTTSVQTLTGQANTLAGQITTIGVPYRVDRDACLAGH